MYPSAAEAKHLEGRAVVLRSVLSDKAWHTGTELVRRVGHRFGSPLEHIRNGWDDGPPWMVVKERVLEDGRLWRYRYVGPNPNPRPRPGLTWKGRAIAAERRVAELEKALRRAAAPLQGVLL